MQIDTTTLENYLAASTSSHAISRQIFPYTLSTNAYMCSTQYMGKNILIRAIHKDKTLKTFQMSINRRKDKPIV